jgi:hypothetical protein
MKNEKENQKPNDELSNADLEKVVGGSLMSTLSTLLQMINDTSKSTIANIRA